MAVNSSALEAVEWCNPSTSCHGFCCSVAIIASGDGCQMVKWCVRVCVYFSSMCVRQTESSASTNGVHVCVRGEGGVYTHQTLSAMFRCESAPDTRKLVSIDLP